MIMFESFGTWRDYSRNAIRHLAVGICRVCVSLFVGAASLFRALWRVIVRAVGRHPSIAVCAFLAAVFFAWLLTFMTMRARAVSAEAQRDSLAWQYTAFKESHGYE